MAKAQKAAGTKRQAAFGARPLTLWAGLALLFVHILLSPLVFSAATVEVFEYNKVAILQGTAILLAAGAAAVLARRWIAAEQATEPLAASVVRVLREPVALGMLLFFVSAACSTAVSMSRRTSFYGCHESFAGILTISSYTVLFFATRAICRDLKDWRLLLFASAAAAAAASLYGYIQFTGLDLIKWGRTSEWGEYTRVFATMGHPNFLAAFLLMAYPVVIYFAVRAFRQGLGVLGAALVLTAVLDTGMVVISLSRGAWAGAAAMGLTLVLGFWLVAGDRRSAAWIAGTNAAAVLAVLLVAFVPPPGTHPVIDSLRTRVEQIFSVQAVTEGTRRYIWGSSIQMFFDHPIFGVGLDTFQLAFERYRSAAYWHIEWNGTPTKAHNEALHILATQGILGAVATLVMTAGIGVAFVRAVRRGVPDRHLLVTALAGAVGFYVQNIFSFTVAGIGTLFVTFAALLSRLGESPEPFSKDAGAGHAAARARSPEVLLASLGAQAAIYVAAAFAIYFIVIVPYKANALCRTGGANLTAADDPRSAPTESHRRFLTREAVEALRESVRVDPTKELYWVRLGTANQAAAKLATGTTKRDLLQKAREAHERSIALIPENAYNHANLGRLLGEMAKESPPMATYAEAMARLDKALEIDANNAYFYTDAANTALSANDVERARRYATICAEKYPEFGPPSAQLGLVKLAEAQGKPPAEAAARYEESVRLLKESIGKDWQRDFGGRGIAASNLSAALIRLHRYPEALRAAAQALADAPDYVDGWVNYGTALEATGNYAAAHEQFVRVLKVRPDQMQAREALRLLRLKMRAAGMPLPALDPDIQKLIDEPPPAAPR